MPDPMQPSEDTVDPQTNMSPREAADWIGARNKDAERFLNDPWHAARQLDGWEYGPHSTLRTMSVFLTLKNWHAAKAAAGRWRTVAEEMPPEGVDVLVRFDPAMAWSSEQPEIDWLKDGQWFGLIGDFATPRPGDWWKPIDRPPITLPPAANKTHEGEDGK